MRKSSFPGLTVDVAVATFGHRIGNVAALVLPPQEGVRYIVSWQSHQDLPVPEELLREDVDVLRFDSPGLSANRNNAVAHCRADVVVIADDDIRYRPEAFDIIRNFYEGNPSVAMALFRAEFPSGKCYPPSATLLSIPFPKGYYVSAVEITFRRRKMAWKMFHPALGLGNEWFSASEDEFFVVSALRDGCEVMLVPETICSHPHISTGVSAPTPGVLRSSGALIRIEYPGSWPLRLFLKAWRSRRVRGFAVSLWHLASGAFTKSRLEGDGAYQKSK